MFYHAYLNPWIRIVKTPPARPQEEAKILLGNAVKSAQISLGLIPEILNTVNMILLAGKQLTMIDPAVLKVRHVENVVTG